MKYTSLGRTGVRVSELCFGAMSFGGDADEQESGRMFAACRDAGINFFDCADIYSGGAAETILGRLMKGGRDELVITSKVFNRMGGDINSGGGNRRHIMRAVEASLQRLGTDRLDVYFMHRWDPVVPLEETLRALEQLVAGGKVLYLGASNYAAWQVARGLGISENNGWPRFDVIQPMYSLVKRQVESEILPLARAENIGVISYSPLGGGLLTGKYTAQNRPEAGRLVANREYAACATARPGSMRSPKRSPPLPGSAASIRCRSRWPGQAPIPASPVRSSAAAASNSSGPRSRRWT